MSDTTMKPERLFEGEVVLINAAQEELGVTPEESVVLMTFDLEGVMQARPYVEDVETDTGHVTLIHEDQTRVEFKNEDAAVVLMPYPEFVATWREYRRSVDRPFTFGN